ncbi:MAG: DUF4019 domain-containing protein [Myxococcales bacterium]
MRKLTMGIVAAFGLTLGMQAALAGEAAKPEPKPEAKADTKDKEKAAVAAAEAWLKLVDYGKYAGSWKEAATFFKGAMKSEQWEQALTGVRKPLGKVGSRKVKTTKYLTSVPGAPDGEYVVIEFDTSFAEKKAAVETVTPMMDKDGKWRVSGYFIK